MSNTLRIGLIVPSGGPESDYYGVEEAAAGALKLYVTISRVGGDPDDDHNPEALKQTGQAGWLVEAAERLATMRLDAIHWACTSGSFVLGRAYAQEQAEALTRALGVPASSTSLAFAAACAQTGVRRVAVLATYPQPTARLFVDFLAEYGIETASLHCLGAPSGWDVARFGEEIISEGIAQLPAGDFDAILVPDTALASLHFLDRLERRLGKPVLTANAVTLWDAQRIAGRIHPVTGFGSLLARMPADAATAS